MEKESEGSAMCCSCRLFTRAKVRAPMLSLFVHRWVMFVQLHTLHTRAVTEPLKSRLLAQCVQNKPHGILLKREKKKGHRAQAGCIVRSATRHHRSSWEGGERVIFGSELRLFGSALLFFLPSSHPSSCSPSCMHLCMNPNNPFLFFHPLSLSLLIVSFFFSRRR